MGIEKRTLSCKSSYLTHYAVSLGKVSVLLYIRLTAQIVQWSLEFVPYIIHRL